MEDEELDVVHLLTGLLLLFPLLVAFLLRLRLGLLDVQIHLNY